MIEVGLVGKTMHQVDERAPVEEIRGLQRVYERLIERYFGVVDVSSGEPRRTAGYVAS